MEQDRQRFIESLQREVREQEAEDKKFFRATKKFEDGLLRQRGRIIEIEIEKTDGTSRALNGTLKFSEKTGRFFVDENCLGEKEDLKGFNINRIKRIRINHQDYFPQKT